VVANHNQYLNIDQVTDVAGIITASSERSRTEGYTYDRNGNRTNAGYVTGRLRQVISFPIQITNRS
jgi:hypothetical protein